MPTVTMDQLATLIMCILATIVTLVFTNPNRNSSTLVNQPFICAKPPGGYTTALFAQPEGFSGRADCAPAPQPPQRQVDQCGPRQDDGFCRSGNFPGKCCQNGACDIALGRNQYNDNCKQEVGGSFMPNQNGQFDNGGRCIDDDGNIANIQDYCNNKARPQQNICPPKVKKSCPFPGCPGCVPNNGSIATNGGQPNGTAWAQNCRDQNKGFLSKMMDKVGMSTDGSACASACAGRQTQGGGRSVPTEEELTNKRLQQIREKRQQRDLAKREGLTTRDIIRPYYEQPPAKYNVKPPKYVPRRAVELFGNNDPRCGPNDQTKPMHYRDRDGLLRRTDGAAVNCDMSGRRISPRKAMANKKKMAVGNQPTRAQNFQGNRGQQFDPNDSNDYLQPNNIYEMMDDGENVDDMDNPGDPNGLFENADGTTGVTEGNKLSKKPGQPSFFTRLCGCCGGLKCACPQRQPTKSKNKKKSKKKGGNKKGMVLMKLPEEQSQMPSVQMFSNGQSLCPEASPEHHNLGTIILAMCFSATAVGFLNNLVAGNGQAKHSSAENFAHLMTLVILTVCLGKFFLNTFGSSRSNQN